MTKQTKAKKKWFIIGGIIALLVILGIALPKLGGGKDPGMQVNTVAVEEKPISQTLTVKAPLIGADSIEVTSSVHAKVTAVNVQEGDRVSAGQVLATLDDTVLAQNVTTAQNSVELARLQMEEGAKSKQLGYDQAALELATAESELARQEPLFEAGAIAETEIEKYRLAVTQAKQKMASYTTSDGKVLSTAVEQKNIEVAQADLASKQKTLADARLISPIDGVVTRVNIKVGRYADNTENKAAMFVIEDLDHLKMKVSISEFDIGKIAVGQKASIKADVLGNERVGGVVERISPTGELAGGNSTSRVIPTTIALTENHPKLIAGINATAEIAIASEDQALVVPLDSVLTDDDGTTYVYKVENNTLVKVPVTLGIQNPLNVAVTGELKSGDQIVLGGDAKVLSEGITVTVKSTNNGQTAPAAEQK